MIETNRDQRCEMYTNSTVLMMHLPFSIGEYLQIGFWLESGLTSVFFSKNSKYALRC